VHLPSALVIQIQTLIVHHVITAIKTCATENVVRRYENRNVCILSECLALIEAPENCQIGSKLVWLPLVPICLEAGRTEQSSTDMALLGGSWQEAHHILMN
jgi:hypothetical protein